MNVDLPAPLSPRTQVTLPASTVVEMSSSEMTVPKYFEIPRISSSGRPSPDAVVVSTVVILSTVVTFGSARRSGALWCCPLPSWCPLWSSPGLVTFGSARRSGALWCCPLPSWCPLWSSSGLLGVAAHELVGQDREQQHRAQEELEPVGVPAGVDDSLGGHPEDERAERGADHRAVPAGEQAAADDRGDDERQLGADAAVRLHRGEPDGLDRADEPRGPGHDHE